MKKHIIILLPVLLLGSLLLRGQERSDRDISSARGKCYVRAGIESRISGDGFGNHYLPYIGFRVCSRVFLQCGPVLDLNREITGYAASVRLNLMPMARSYSRRVALDAFFTLEQQKDISLSMKSCIMESRNNVRADGLKQINWSEIRFNENSFNAGIQCSIRIVRELHLNLSACASAFKTSRINYKETGLFHPSGGVVTGVGIGLEYDFRFAKKNSM